MKMVRCRNKFIGAVAAVVFAVTGFVPPVNAALVGSYILETDTVFDATFGAGNHNLSQDLILTTGGGGAGVSASQARTIAEAENEALVVLGADVFANVEQIVIYEAGTPGTFESVANNGIFTSAAISITRFNEFEFGWALVENADAWNVVKVGVKSSQETAFFLVDPFAGRDSGRIDIRDLVALYDELDGSVPANQGPGTAGVFTNQNGVVQAISNITFFGTQTIAVPEPGTMALFGIGLLGLGFMKRRRGTA